MLTADTLTGPEETPTMPHRRDPLLLATGLMAGLTLVFAAAMLLDPRTIDGAPAWLKPAKFAVSTAIYSATLAWVLRHLPDWPRLARRVAMTTAAVFVIEVALIALQAARGTSSHFNTRTLLDGAIFSTMGIAIGLQTLAAAATMVALWRQTFADRARGFALRFGMTIAVIGASVGGIMTSPTSAQLAAARETGAMPRSGAHTVGAPDGGPGLPGTGWSREHGDLRVPHFVGLHALQVLPFVVLVLGRRSSAAARVRLAVGAATSYATLLAILLAQALIGESVAAPSGATATALTAWTIGTVGFALAVWRARDAPARHGTAREVA
jgi:hypothetical protein